LRNQLACRLVRNVVAVSDDLAERFCRFTAEAGGPIGLLGYKALRRKMHAISYGIDLRAYDAVTAEEIASLRARAGAGEDSVLVGSVGRLVEQKDYPTQLGAFARAAREEPRLRMVLAGDGPLRADLEARVRELEIADRVVFLGHWAKVPALLRALDIFVLASKFEPYGVALLEAKGAGCAIVATAVNEIPKLLTDGDTALLTPPESEASLAAAYLRLARDHELRGRLAARGREDAEHRHSLQAVVNAYQALYD